MLGSGPAPLLHHAPPPLHSHCSVLLKVVENIPDPNQDCAGAKGDEDADDHYHCHGDGPLVQVVAAGMVIIAMEMGYWYRYTGITAGEVIQQVVITIVMHGISTFQFLSVDIPRHSAFD